MNPIKCYRCVTHLEKIIIIILHFICNNNTNIRFEFTQVSCAFCHSTSPPLPTLSPILVLLWPISWTVDPHSPWACCLLWPRDGLSRSLGTGRGSWRHNREKLAVVARLRKVGCRGGPSPLSCVGCDLAGASRWWTLRQAGSPYPGPEAWILRHNNKQ